MRNLLNHWSETKAKQTAWLRLRKKVKRQKQVWGNRMDGPTSN